jgi:hypothetical protein
MNKQWTIVLPLLGVCAACFGLALAADSGGFGGAGGMLAASLNLKDCEDVADQLFSFLTPPDSKTITLAQWEKPLVDQWKTFAKAAGKSENIIELTKDEFVKGILTVASQDPPRFRLPSRTNGSPPSGDPPKAARVPGAPSPLPSQ